MAESELSDGPLAESLRGIGHPDQIIADLEARVEGLRHDLLAIRDVLGESVPINAEGIIAAIRYLQAELAKQEAVMVAADRLKDAYDAMLEGRDIGSLPEWEKRTDG